MHSAAVSGSDAASDKKISRHLRIFIVTSWERWRVPLRGWDDECAAILHKHSQRTFLRAGGAPAFFLFYRTLPRKLKSNYFDASARPGSADSNEFFARASPQFALSTRVKPVRSAQRPSPSRIQTTIHPWSIRDYDFGSSWQLPGQTRIVTMEAEDGKVGGKENSKEIELLSNGYKLLPCHCLNIDNILLWQTSSLISFCVLLQNAENIFENIYY